MKWPAIIAKIRKQRQDVSAFKGLMAAPASDAITLPANARIAFRSIDGSSAGTTAATLVGPSVRTIKTPALAAGEFALLDFAERGTVVTPEAGFEILLDTGLGKFVKIGSSGGGGGSFPAWRDGQEIGEWRELTGTNISSVAPTPTPAGNIGPRAKIDAWTSLVVDKRNNKVYSAAGGGHSDYAGNEVDSIDLSLDSPAWVELRAPTSAGNVVTGVDYYNDGRPSARHTYYGVVICEQKNELIILGGSIWNPSSATLTRDLAAFDLTTNDWKANGTRPDMPVGTTTLEAAAITIDDSTGNIYVMANEMINRWTESSNAWVETVPQYGGPYGFRAMSAHDTTRNRILIVGGLAGNAKLYDLSDDSMSTPTLSGASASAVATQNDASMIYDEVIDRFLIRLGGSGGTVYQINPSTFEVTTFTTSAGGSIPAITDSGPYNKFLYVPLLGGCVYIPSYSGNIWFLRTH